MSSFSDTPSTARHTHGLGIDWLDEQLLSCLVFLKDGSDSRMDVWRWMAGEERDGKPSAHESKHIESRLGFPAVRATVIIVSVRPPIRRIYINGRIRMDVQLTALVEA